MAQVYCWDDLITATTKLFPETDLNTLLLAEDNLGLLMREIAEAHDLTLAEAAELVALRLPYYAPNAWPALDQRLLA